MREGSKAFFFEKKKQKTFVSALLPMLRRVLKGPGRGKCAETKVFWSFFSKKDCLLAFFLTLPTAAQPQTYPPLAGEPDPRDFVKRAGSALTLQGRPMRFGGVNITWLGLRQDGTGEIRRPTAYEVRDALATAHALGAEVVRLPGLASTAGCKLCLEPAPGEMNPDVFAQIDLILVTARDMGLKLILPLADSGVDCGGAGATGVICASTKSPPGGAPPGQASFFTDARVQAAFAARVRAILTHVNTVSGATYGNDPAILAWEDCDACAAAGDANAVSAWVEHTGQMVKTADTRHLYESGAFAGRIGPASKAPAAPALYTTPSVDVIGDHPAIAGDAASTRAALSHQVQAIAPAGRAYVLDDFGWSPAAWRTEADLEAWLADMVRERLLQGAFTGNLQGHADQGGYLPPPPAGAGLAALYFPGFAIPDIDRATMAERGRALRRFNFAMMDVTLPPSYLLTPQPEILGAAHGRVTWRGSAGAASYTVERSSDPSAPGTWTMICDACATDSAGYWQDPTPPASPEFYRMMPLNINGHKAVPSEPFKGS